MVTATLEKRPLQAHVPRAVVTFVYALAACAPDTPDPWKARPSVQIAPAPVDCVAVLGALPGTMAQTPLADVPYSGLDRNKTIAMLDDDEFARFCDFYVCLRANGYSRKCYRSPIHPPPFSVGRGFTCFPNVDPRDGNAELAWGSRQICIDIYRRHLGTCQIGLLEDCGRELAVRVLASEYTPSCEQVERECPFR